jgi:hypothetical protein
MPRYNIAGRHNISATIRTGIANGLNNAQILESIRTTFPEALTRDQQVRWYRWKMRREQLHPVGTPADRYGDLSATRYFGIEFEFLTRNRTGTIHYIEDWANIIRPVIEAAGQTLLVTDGYSHSDGTCWHLKTDSTAGYELATPKSRASDWPTIAAVLKALRKAGAKVNRSCGMHIHHAARDYNERDIVNLCHAWATYGDVISRVLPPSRRNNTFAMPIGRGAINWDRYSAERYTHKYRALNLSHFWSSKRLEVRQHHGTLDPEKVYAWVVFTQRIINAARERSRFTPNRAQAVWRRPFDRQLEGLAKWAKIPERIKAVYADRLLAA